MKVPKIAGQELAEDSGPRDEVYDRLGKAAVGSPAVKAHHSFVVGDVNSAVVADQSDLGSYFVDMEVTDYNLVYEQVS